MTSGKTIILAVFAASSAIAHPLSPDSLLSAPTRGPAMKRFANPDVFPTTTTDAASMGHPLATMLSRDPHVVTSQKLMANRLGMQPSECGTLLVMTGRYKDSEPAMIAQTFRAAASPQGLIATNLNSSLSTTNENADLGKWLNAYDYEYRLPTQSFYALGIPISIGIGKLKVCPK